MTPTLPSVDLAPVPADVTYLGTFATTMYYDYGGIVWGWTPAAWQCVCLIDEWSDRPEATAIARQGRCNARVINRPVHFASARRVTRVLRERAI